MTYLHPPGSAVAAGRWRIGDWTVDTVTDVIEQDGDHVKLEPRTMKLLLKLAEKPGDVISTQQLLDSVWSEVVVGPASVYQAVSQLRKVLRDTEPVPSYIATVSRKGYRLIAPTERLAESPNTNGHAVPEAFDALNDVQESRWLPWIIGAGLLALVIFLVWELGRTQLQTDSAEQTAALSLPDAPADARTLVVLPFDASGDEAHRALAPIVTDLVRNRLAQLPGSTVITGASTASALQSGPDTAALARRLNARYFVRGNVNGAPDEIRVIAKFVDASTGAEVWSTETRLPRDRLADVPNDIVKRTAESLKVTSSDTAAASRSDRPIDVQAYELYLRGQQLMATFRAGDAQQAIAIFSRVTALDPSFARGYHELGMSLLLAADLGAREMNADLRLEASKAFDRAIELDPGLGQAWAQRARLTPDPVKAEEYFRRALQLSPGYDESYLRYSDFLFAQRRRGEALELIDRAQRIDPLSPAISWKKAQYLIAARGDVAGSQQLLREALVILPEFPTALRDLAISRWLFSGQEGEAIASAEQAMANDPETTRADWINVGLYLDIGDLQAARAVVRDARQPDSLDAQMQWVTIDLYEGKLEQAAARAGEVYRRAMADSSRVQTGADARAFVAFQEVIARYSPGVLALRDQAIATGNFQQALDVMAWNYQQYSSTSMMRSRGSVLVYANTLILAGRTQQARSILESLLEHMEAESVGRPPHWFAWERAAVYAMLEEPNRALDELEASQRSGRFHQWWYIADRDPIYNGVRQDPRFQSLVKQWQLHSKAQQALLERMRDSHVVPRRA